MDAHHVKPDGVDTCLIQIFDKEDFLDTLRVLSNDRGGGNHPAVAKEALVRIIEGDTIFAPQGVLLIREDILQTLPLGVICSITFIYVWIIRAVVVPEDSIPACEGLISPVSSALSEHIVEVYVAMEESIN